MGVDYLNNLFNGCGLDIFNNCNFGNLDINKLLIILLLLTDQLNIEAIHVYRNNYVISLGTFTEQ